MSRFDSSDLCPVLILKMLCAPCSIYITLSVVCSVFSKVCLSMKPRFYQLQKHCTATASASVLFSVECGRAVWIIQSSGGSTAGHILFIEVKHWGELLSTFPCGFHTAVCVDISAVQVVIQHKIKYYIKCPILLTLQLRKTFHSSF